MERQWRTLRDMAQCMISYSGLGPQYWGYAFLYSAFIRNRVWSSGPRNIPYMLVTGNAADLGILRTFGCPAYVHIDKSRRNKLDPTAWVGVMVGLSRFACLPDP